MLRQAWGTPERAHPADLGDRLGRHGGGVRQHGPPRRRRRGRGQRAVRPADVRRRGPLRCRGGRRSSTSGARRSTSTASLAAHPSPAIIAAVHAETSTGVRSDIAALGAAKGDALLLVDAVTSIGGIELRADDWGVDVGYAGTQKCLGVAPGLAPFTINDRAFERRVEKPAVVVPRPRPARRVRRRGQPRAGGRTYHHTAPVAMVASLHGGLDPDPRGGPRGGLGAARGRRPALQDGLEEMGLELFAAEGLPAARADHRPGARRASTPPPYAGTCSRRHDIEIGAGAGAYAATVWRIGLMGRNARPDRRAAGARRPAGRARQRLRPGPTSPGSGVRQVG